MDSRRKRIIDAVKTRLEYIQIANGFKTDCGLTTNIMLTRLEETAVPCCNIFPEIEAGKPVYSAGVWTMPTKIELIQEYAITDDPYILADEMLSDATEAIEATHYNIEFGTGSSEVSTGDRLTNGTYTWYVSKVVVNSGDWGSGTAAGNIWVRRGSEPLNVFIASELLDIVGGDLNAIRVVAMTNADQIGENIVIDDLARLVQKGGIMPEERGTASYSDPKHNYVGVALTYNLLYKIPNGNPYA